MTHPTSSRRTSRRPLWLAALPIVGIVGLLGSALLAMSDAQQAVPSGEELYVDRLGCWNCHGQSGGGGAGRAIAKTRLPLRKFVQYVRLPSGTMPPFAAVLASDDELAILYRWLGGVEAVKSPPPVGFRLKGSTEVTADGQTRADTQVELSVLPAATTLGSELSRSASLRYRVTLTQASTPVANRTFECQLAGQEGWSKFTTDEHGEALLGPEQSLVFTDAREAQEPKASARLRIALAPGRYALLVEAIDYAERGSPVVVGIGTEILSVE